VLLLQGCQACFQHASDLRQRRTRASRCMAGVAGQVE
jgi:hypothetical protein